MAIVPTGHPCWVRANSHTTYGGNVNKIDYQSIGPVNPRTDIGAAQFCRLASDVAAIQLTAPFATVTYLCNDTVAAVPTVEEYDAMVGAAPTGIRNGDGDITFTWLDSYADPYSVIGEVNIEHAEATGHAPVAAPATPLVATVELLDLSATGKNESVRVRVWDVVTGLPAVDPRVTLVVTTGVV